MIISAWLSVLVSLVVLTMKTWAFLQTQSTAIFSDALETVVNVFASLVALKVMKAVAEPADEEHPYGHGKLEYFSSAFEGGLIAFAAIAIAFGAARSLWLGISLNNLDTGLVIMVITGVINLLMGLHLLKIGTQSHSAALKASGQHLLSDVITTVSVLVGLGLVRWTGFHWIDPVVAILVAVQLLFSGWRIVRSSLGALIDEKEPEALEQISKAICQHRHSGIIDIHNVRVIRSGRFHHIDAHIVVPEFWNVSQAHQVCHDFEKEVVKTYPYDGEFAFHIDPCAREWCTFCDQENCSIRLKNFVKQKNFSSESIVKGPLKT